MNAHPEGHDPLDQLATRVTDLEMRVTALEHSGRAAEPQPSSAIHPVASVSPRSVQHGKATASPGLSGILPVGGAALLGIAGAYLLRAISEASLLPRAFVAAVAAAYAAAWLLAAARSKIHEAAAVLYTVTSVLILASMLWEMSVRFKAMSPESAVALLATYAALAAGIGFKTSRSRVFAVAFAGTALTAVAESIGTHQIALFAALLLSMLAVAEFTPLRRVSSLAGVLVALCADFVVWTMIFIYRMPAAARIDYAPLGSPWVMATALLLFLIQAIVIFIRSVAHSEAIAFRQIAQSIIVFCLLVCALSWLTSGTTQLLIGLLCLLVSAACYALAFGPSRRTACRRNFVIFHVWGSILLFGAILLLSPGQLGSVLIAMTGMFAVITADRSHLPSLEIQGVIFVSLAAALFGLVGYSFRSLAGQMPGRPAWGILVVLALIVIASAASHELPGESASKQVLHLVPAFLAAAGVASMLVHAFYHLISAWLVPGVFHIALLRTFVLCALSFLLAWWGVRFSRLQITRIAYAALGFAAIKLLFEDLRHGRMEFIAGSIFLVALTAIEVPRVIRGRGTNRLKQAH